MLIIQQSARLAASQPAVHNTNGYPVSDTGSLAATCSGVPDDMLSKPCCQRCRELQAALPCRDQLFADFTPLVQHLLRQYAGEAPEFRQDLAGDIYCRFCELLDAFEPERGIPLRPYLVRQLTASAYTLARRQWRNRRREIALDPALSEHEGAAREDPTPGWIEDIAAQQVQMLLPHAIACLPDRQRKVIVWRYLDQRPYEAIAASLSIEVATARSLARHGINNMRRWFQARGPEPELGAPASPLCEPAAQRL